MEAAPKNPHGNPFIPASGPEQGIRAETDLAQGTRLDAELSKPEVLHQLFERQAEVTPSNAALCFSDQSLTYAEVEKRANQLAHLLQSLGVGPDVVVALYLSRSVAMVVSALAIMKAGGAYLPIDPSCPMDRLRFLLNDAQAPIVITGQCMEMSLPCQPQHVVVVNPDGRIMREQPSDEVDTSLTSENLAYVIYTSGSTGQPKGVELTHRGLLNLVSWHNCAFNVTATDRASQLAALGFDAAVWEIWPYLAVGASVHLAHGIAVNEPSAVRDWLISQGITVTFLPTPLAEQVMTLEFRLRGA